jgi:hypothetical protein
MSLKSDRKSSALSRLEKQLASGVKTEKRSTSKKVQLSDSDKKRIENEIEILKKSK